MFASSYIASTHPKNSGLEMGFSIGGSFAVSHGGSVVAERRHPTAVRFSLNLPVRQSANQSFGTVERAL